MVIFSFFDEIVERLAKLKKRDFFSIFDQRMDLMPSQVKTTDTFACLTSLRPSFVHQLSKKPISLGKNSWKNNEK